MIALAEEMAGPMTIGELSWQRAGSSGSPQGFYYVFSIHMGLADADELSDTFEDNYVPGSRTLVYTASTQKMTAEPDQWMTILLDTPFQYDGTHNLIVEIQWIGGANMFYTYMWETGSYRGLMNKNDAGSPTGTLYTRMSQLMFSPASSLEQHTFGAIKALW